MAEAFALKKTALKIMYVMYGYMLVKAIWQKLMKRQALARRWARWKLATNLLCKKLCSLP